MKKRIVHITFNMGIGGAEQVICNLVENTDKTIYDLSIICLERPVGQFGRQLQQKGYELVAFDRQPGFDLSLIKQIRRYIIKHKVDIIHCHQYTPYVYGLFAALFTGVRTIFTEHGRFYPDSCGFKRVLLNPVLNLFTDHVTAISAATKTALTEFENFPEHKIEVVYNGIDDTRFLLPADKGLRQQLGITPDSYILGAVARLDAVKNHDMMIKALEIVLNQHYPVVLIIIGDGSERERLEGVVAGLGLEKHVIFPGFREDVHRYLGIMDIFLLTSFTEGTAMTLLEAMAASLPCIVTGVGGNGEIVLDGKTGFIVPSDDHNALADKISVLLDDKKLLCRMGNAGRQRFEDCFTVDRMVQAYQAMYGDITKT